MSKELVEGFVSVLDTWGVCSICDGEHAWANVKCDLLDEFVYSPCANPVCDVEYASGEYCSLCEK